MAVEGKSGEVSWKTKQKFHSVEVLQEKHVESWKAFVGERKRLFTYVYQIVKWEEPYHAGIVFSVVSFVFMVIYFLNATFVTTVSLLIGMWTLLALIHPILPRLKFEKWNEKDENKFHDACANLAQVLGLFEQNCQNIREIYEQNKYTLLMRLLVGVVLLAFAGSFVSDLVFAYLAVLTLLALPGLVHRNLLEKPLLQGKEHDD